MKTVARLVAPVDSRDHIRGPKDAPVTIVEYGDFECAYSGQAHYALQRLSTDMPMFRLVYRHFPLTQIHPNALAAALAAEAAAAQGAFWEMHDLLFEHQDSLEPESLIAYAQVLGLDVEQFIVDLTSDASAANVREDFVSGLRSGVNGTPTFYINSERYDGSDEYDALKAAIEEAAKSRTRNVTKAKNIITRGESGAQF
ncbi:DsbA family protein [Candidatus Saccharibacteria bacterium]|nr:DsbA family protein [Candidatus Saccharibacteria bacterium]